MAKRRILVPIVWILHLLATSQKWNVNPKRNIVAVVACHKRTAIHTHPVWCLTGISKFAFSLINKVWTSPWIN